MQPQTDSSVTNIGVFALLLDYLTPSSWSTSSSTHVTTAAVSSVLHDSNAVGSAARGGAGARGALQNTPLPPPYKNYMSYR